MRSDIFTLSFPFEPWRREEAIADGEHIWQYLADTADKYHITVTALQQSIVDNIVSAAGYSPKILSRTDKQLADFLNDDGCTVDAAKVTQAVTEAATELNIARKPHPPAPNPQQGRGTGQPRDESSWSKTLKG